MMYRKVTDMWEDETVVLMTSLKKRILQGSEKVRFGKITSDQAIPDYVKRVFMRRVEFLIRKEAPFSIQATPHFEIRREDIERLQAKFFEIFKEAATFSSREVDEILRRALVLRLDYLIKPADTMRRLLFEERKEISLENVEPVFGSIVHDLPYAETVLRTCLQKNLTLLNNETYSEIVSDVMQRIFESDPVSETLRDFSVLTDFLSESKGEDVIRVEGGVLQQFLADRNLWNFRRALDVEMKLGKSVFLKEDLEMILKRYIEFEQEFSTSGSEGQETFVEEPKTDSQHEDVFSISEVDEPEESITGMGEDKTEISSEETWDLDQMTEPDTEKHQETEITEAPHKTSKEKYHEITENEDQQPAKPKTMRIIRRDQKNEEEEESGEAALLSNTDDMGEYGEKPIEREGLGSFIETKSEKIFIKKLFNGDDNSYHDLINKLNEAESWRVAKILIDNELFKRDVDPFSREAIKLVDLVYSRYYPEEGVGGSK
ncbi:MAG TPA: hypothetical protein ENN03_08960 [bacterium]|nr:hypothetical protein [bacterium]